MQIIKKLGSFLVLIIAGIGFLAGIMLFLEKLIIPRDYYFYQYNSVSEKVMIYLILIPAVTVFGVLSGKLRQKKSLLWKIRTICIFSGSACPGENSY